MTIKFERAGGYKIVLCTFYKCSDICIKINEVLNVIIKRSFIYFIKSLLIKWNEKGNSRKILFVT